MLVYAVAKLKLFYSCRGELYDEFRGSAISVALRYAKHSWDSKFWQKSESRFMHHCQNALKNMPGYLLNILFSDKHFSFEWNIFTQKMKILGAKRPSEVQ